ncbi:MAG TPA: GldG family protein [Cyclobacteriaceae bacterium]|nr:GldG family protein [Cyclobacteriaceae bacterium]
MKQNKVITQIAVILAIIITVNLISGQIYLRLDFTADKRYTLSQATRDILDDLNDVITVKAYYSKDLPPQLLNEKKDFNDMLIEYEKRSGSNILFEFINPNENEQEETKAQQAGINPIMVNVTERDQVKQMRAYMGAVLQMGEKTEVIPVLRPGAGMEYELTTAIKKLSVNEKPKVAFIQGHGEPSMYASAQVVQALSVLNTVEEYTLTDSALIPSTYKTIVIINPEDTIPAPHFRILDTYLAGGGNIFIAFNPLQADLSRAYLGSSIDIGLREWLQGKGITINDFYLVDATCGSVQVRQQQGPFIMNTQVSFPYFPVIGKFADHAAVKGIESLFLPFASSITYLPVDSMMVIEPLAFTSDNTGMVTAPNFIDINKEWSENDFKLGSQVVAVAATGPLGGKATSSARMIVVANGSYAIGGSGQQSQQVSQDNVNFEVNAIDWLSDDTGLNSLRTKGVTNRPLEQVDDTKRNLIKYLNAFLPVALVLMIGVVRRQQYLKKKQKWIEGNY